MNDPILSYTEDDIERVCSTLRTISKQYPGDSPEACALKDAAFAFVFLVQHKDLKIAFEKYQAASKQPLGPAELETLKSMGIEP